MSQRPNQRLLLPGHERLSRRELSLTLAAAASGRPAAGAQVARRTPLYRRPTMASANMTVAFKKFRGTMATWDELFADAARFASRLKPEHLISISHSADHSDGVVTVWYWANPASTADTTIE